MIVSTSNKLLREIVSRFGFALSNVPNLSNTVPNSLGISNEVCCWHVQLTKLG